MKLSFTPDQTVICCEQLMIDVVFKSHIMLEAKSE